jgi:hypothetical protein
MIPESNGTPACFTPGAALNDPCTIFIDPSQHQPGSKARLIDEERKYGTKCSYAGCGKTFKDLKSHMLTHQTNRPERCPVEACIYHTKGFARKADRIRHTLTHYKGVLVCGFCPNDEISDEKSFNRVDLFKRHLISVHHVGPPQPNSRKRTFSGHSKGMKVAPVGHAPCGTCLGWFYSAQEFYEHLEDCVLQVILQVDPAEAINAAHLAEVDTTLSDNEITNEDTAETKCVSYMHDGVEVVDEDSTHRPKLFGDEATTAAGARRSNGLPHFVGGGFRDSRANDRKATCYPYSWADSASRSHLLRRRVMACFNGPRRLVKDDYLLHLTQEVRIELADGQHYVTDLDRHTMDRAEAIFSA